MLINGNFLVATQRGALGLALAVALACAGTAQAANYSLSVRYIDNRGSISLPLPPSLGGVGPGVHNTPNATASQTGAPVAGGGPATINLPASNIFDPPNFEGFLIPVPSVIQLSTSFSHIGPTTPATLMASRSGPHDFAYCPGAAANPNCSTVTAGGTQGDVNGIIKYTSGPNKFGGTFKMLLKGTGKLTRKGDALPPTVMTTMGGTETALPFSAVNIFLGGSGLIPGGLAYANMTTNALDSSPNTHPLGYMSTIKGLLTRYSVAIGTALPESNQQTGFPMTTGTVYQYRVIPAQAGSFGLPSKFTETGYDKRTAGGAGRIQLVAGNLSRTFPTDGSNPPEGSSVNRAKLTLTFLPTPALPIGPGALVALGSLLAVSAGYAASRKRP